MAQIPNNSRKDKPKKYKVSITLDCDLIPQIKKLAEEDDRSFSQYVNLILRQHVAAENEENTDPL